MTLHLAPAWNAAPAPFRHTFAGLGNIDQFRWLSRADVHEHLRMARDELGLRHVRAAAMYSPEMRVWAPKLSEWRIAGDAKSSHANWQLVDLSIEALLDLGLKPIYTTCFTPLGFSDNPASCWPDHNPIGMPRDLSQWQSFVSDGLRHHLARYGKAELRSWYFECWNEPNLSGFFASTQEDFFRLWSATWHAVKSVDPELRFGGPSTARGEWMEDFLEWTAKDGTPPDYLITHCYNNDSESQPLSPFDGPASHKVKDSPHFTTGLVRGLRKTLDARGWQGEVHWNEWGRSWFPHDPVKETAVEAAFIVKTMGEVGQHADGFGFWCLSDIYDQIGLQSGEFDANYGMCSLHGLRKPAWNAHVMLNRLGTAQVPVTGGNELEGAVATPTERGASVLVWRYPATVDAAPTSGVVEVELPATGSGPVQLFRIDARENNVIARWRAMGAPAYPTRRQITDLKAQDRLQPAQDLVIETSGGRRIARFTLENPGVALIET